jgi:predicted outer membrane repeat protein
LWCYNSPAALTNVSFVGNHVGTVGGIGDGGGLSANFQSAVQLTDVAFVENTAAGDGGGAYFTGASVLTRCWFERNSAEWGGGLACVGGWCSPLIREVTLVANSASAGGGISSRDEATPVLENVTVVGNVADYGAGIDIAQSSYVTIDTRSGP